MHSKSISSQVCGAEAVTRKIHSPFWRDPGKSRQDPV